MIEQIILDKKEYKILLNKCEIVDKLIKIKPYLPNCIEFSSFYKENYRLENVYGKDIIPEIRDMVKLKLDKELEILNEKLKEFTLLKAEIEVLYKQMKNDTGNKEVGEGL